jgi:hypothetical protein
VLKKAAPVVLALCAGACSSMPTSFDQISAPKFDKLFVPNPTEFAPKQPALTAVAPTDLVDGSGYCAGGAPPPAPAAASSEHASAPAAATAAAAVGTGRNVALQMTECEVVNALGHPAEVQIAANERGERAVTMTYMTPERPIYRFTAGRLSTIERGAEPPPPEPVTKRPPAKKKPAAKPYTPPRTQS